MSSRRGYGRKLRCFRASIHGMEPPNSLGNQAPADGSKGGCWTFAELGAGDSGVRERAQEMGWMDNAQQVALRAPSGCWA